MDRVHFLTEGPNGDLELCQPGYKDAATARKHIVDLSLGTYHLVNFIETGITVEEPAMPTKPTIKRGVVLGTRQGKASE